MSDTERTISQPLLSIKKSDGTYQIIVVPAGHLLVPAKNRPGEFDVVSRDKAESQEPQTTFRTSLE